MSDNQNCGTRDFAKYDSMETEALEEILRLDAEAPEGQESDTEEILYIMEVLAERNKENTGKTALEAWNSLQQQYLSDDKTIPKGTKKAGPWLRRMIAAAAVIAILITVPLSAKAFSWDAIWNTFAKWAKETFSFVTVDQPNATEPSPDNIKTYQSLQEALAASNRDPDIVPTWFPEGFVLDQILVNESPDRKAYVAMYRNEKDAIVITVQSYLGMDAEKVEISNDLLEIYEVNGQLFYIFNNNQQLRAVWVNGSYECYISGELTIAEIKIMIDSIGKG